MTDLNGASSQGQEPFGGESFQDRFYIAHLGRVLTGCQVCAGGASGGVHAIAGGGSQPGEHLPGRGLLGRGQPVISALRAVGHGALDAPGPLIIGERERLVRAATPSLIEGVRQQRQHSCADRRRAGAGSRRSGPVTPALLTSTSMGPSDLDTCLTAAVTASRSQRSAVTATAAPPSSMIWSLACASCSAERATRPTDAPASARVPASSRPRPRLAPVTSATVPPSLWPAWARGGFAVGVAVMPVLRRSGGVASGRCAGNMDSGPFRSAERGLLLGPGRVIVMGGCPALFSCAGRQAPRGRMRQRAVR